MTAPYPTVGTASRSCLYSARVLQVGYTRPVDNGHGSGTYARWGLVPCDPRTKAPVFRWRDGKPRPVGRPVSGKVAPLWLTRAAAFCERCGPLTLHELGCIADWFAEHRTGEPDLASFETPF